MKVLNYSGTWYGKWDEVFSLSFIYKVKPPAHSSGMAIYNFFLYSLSVKILIKKRIMKNYMAVPKHWVTYNFKTTD